METQRDSSLLSKYGALWVAVLTLAVGGIWWAAALSGDVQGLKDEVERRRSAMAMIEGNQRDIARLEAAIDEIETLLDRRVDVRGEFERVKEHLRTLDERMVQLERFEDGIRRNGGQR